MEIGFFLKKFVSFFVEPYGMVLTLFVIDLSLLFMKKEGKAKGFLLAACGMLFLFSYQPFSNALAKNLEEQYPKYAYQQSVQYIHVLGNGHNVDPEQPLSSQISSAGIKRVLEGVLIHKQIEGSKLIFTGYEGDTNTSNAQMNASLAIALGVKPEDIIIGSQPKDTKEEALFTKSLAADEPFILVTSATHMPRAMKLFNSLGLHPIAAPSDFIKDEFKGFLVAPDMNSFCSSQRSVHEYVGILWSKIKD
ncbi:MAG: ElyC/SanA/YdcF family protein [Sulfurimonas sp.]